MSSSKTSPRDFSLFSLFTAGLACLIPVASAYTKPVGASPKGNPFSQPGLNSVVPVGEGFTVTWEPTTTGTVTLVLLKGPSDNIIPQYPIAQKIENSGSFVWVPSKDLAPSETGYGLQLIVDSDGQYQYTTQFGIANPHYHAAASSASASSWPASSAHAGHGPHGGWSSSSAGWASASAPAHHPHHTSMSAHSVPPMSGTGVASSGWFPSNSTIVMPTGTMTVPSSLLTTASLTPSSAPTEAPTATGSAPVATHTNAAAGMTASFAGLVVAAGVAVFAL